MEYPIGQLGSAVPAVSPPSFLCTLSPLTGGAVGGAEKALALCKHCSATTKTLMCYQHYSHPESETLHCTSYWAENYLSQNQDTGEGTAVLQICSFGKSNQSDVR